MAAGTNIAADIIVVIIQDTAAAVTTVITHTMVVIGDITAVIFLGNRFGAEASITLQGIIHTPRQFRKILSRHVAKF